jgi:hypothetical protein
LKKAGICFYTLSEVADLVILAEDTEKTAMGQEYCPRSTGADQGVFFAEMWSITGDNGSGTGPADAFFTGQPLNFALPGANPAGGEHFPGFCNTTPANSPCLCSDKYPACFIFSSQ